MTSARSRPPLVVRVPASTSNLGPGFDTLGVALTLPLEVRVVSPSGGAAHELSLGEGEESRWPPAERNLLVRALDLARGAGAEGEGLALEVRSEIPVSRGLGASGAAVAAGLLLGAELAEDAPGTDELLARGIALEGHPDNVVPALLGGARLALPSTTGAPGGRPLALPVEVHPSLAFALAWPDVEVDTLRARAVLPRTVPLAAAVENARRLAVLLAGLASGDPELLAAGAEDRIHVPHRLPLVPGGAEALGAAREAGAPLATISGSGSALVAVVERGQAAAVAGAMAERLRAASGTASERVLEVAREAPRVEELGG